MVKQSLVCDEQMTPAGMMSFLGDGETIFRIDFGNLDENHDKWENWIKRYVGEALLNRASDPFKQVNIQLSAYFSGEQTEFSFKYTLFGTLFQKQVWEALVEKVPFGETMSYKGIAHAIDNPKAVRAVGGAVNKNPISIVVPCHRIIGADGRMVGYGGGLDKKTYLLALEKEIIT